MQIQDLKNERAPRASTALFTSTALLASIFAASGCNESDGSRQSEQEVDLVSALFAPKEGEALATIDGETVLTVEELREHQGQMSAFARQKLATPEGRKETVEQLSQQEALAREAVRQGLHLDPEVQQVIKRALASKLLSKNLPRSGQEEKLSDERLREYYEENISEFVVPERVRVSHVFFEAGEDDQEAREQARSLAEEKLAELREADGNQVTIFNRAVRDISDDEESRSRGGDLRYLSEEQLTEAWGEPMAKAAFELERAGTISDVVESDKGFHILRFTGRQRAVDRKFEEVRPQLSSRARRDDRRARFESFVSEIVEREGLSINEENLEKLDELMGPRQGEMQQQRGARAPASSGEEG